jgi:hypothetical protein
MGLLALKTLAKRKLQKGEVQKWTKCWYAPVDTPEEVLLSLRFTLSLPVTAAVSPSHSELLWLVCDAAEKYKPLSKEELSLVARRAEGLDPLFVTPKK